MTARKQLERRYAKRENEKTGNNVSCAIPAVRLWRQQGAKQSSQHRFGNSKRQNHDILLLPCYKFKPIPQLLKSSWIVTKGRRIITFNQDMTRCLPARARVAAMPFGAIYKLQWRLSNLNNLHTVQREDRSTDEKGDMNHRLIVCKCQSSRTSSSSLLQ